VTPAEGGTDSYTVVLLSAPTGAVTVTPRVVGNPDVTVQPPALTFTATTWETVRTVTVRAAEDADAEEDTATITHTVAGADYGSVTAADVSVRVTEDETASTSVTLSVEPDSVSESAGATQVEVTGELNHAPRTSTTTVSVSVSAGTASSADYGSPSGFTLTIDAGATSGTATFTLTPVNDAVDEDAETVTVGGTAGHGLSVTAATLTIQDDDTRGVQVSENGVTVPEGGTDTYMVALLSAPTGQVTVTPTATGNPDVTVEPAALTFTATTWETARTVTVRAAEDADAEPDTATITHTVSGADYGSVTAASVSVTVTENETGSTGVTLTVDPPSVSEGAGATQVTVKGELDHAPRTSATTVSVTISAGTASTSDFGSVSGFTLTIAAGETSGTATFTLTPVNDDVDETEETVTVGGTAGHGLAVTAATLTIQDDDTRGVEVSARARSPPEGGSAAYTVKLLSAPTGPVTVTPAATGSPDVTVEPAALTFTASTWSAAQTVTVRAAEDDDAEEDTATITHTVSGADYGSVTAASVSVTVTENETASTGVTLTVDPPSLSEAAGATQVTVKGELDHAPRTSATTVSIAVSAGTASTSDFVAVSSFVLTIAQGETSGTATFSFTPVNDAVDEDAETATVGGTAGHGLSVTAAALTITDDDTRGVRVSSTEVTPAEGGSATYTVVLLSAPTGTVTVTPGVGGNSDVTVQPPALTFTATTWSAAQTVTVRAAEDADAEEDTATIMHTVAGADYGSETAADVAVRVTENETVSTGVTLSVGPDAVSESAGAVSVTVTGMLNAAPLMSATTVSVSVSAGTASTDDFAAVPAFSLTIDSGETSGKATFTLTPVNDAVDEEAETVTVAGTAGHGLAVTAAALTITDDDTRGVEVSRTEVTPTEGGTDTYTVALRSAPTGQVTVTPSVGGNADVTVDPAVLTFTATTWSAAQTVTVSAAEDEDAEADTATITHTVAGADYGSETAASVAVTVTDNETASTGVTLSVDPDSVAENAGATSVVVTGTLNAAPLTSAAVVSVSVSAGTASTSDFGSVSGFTLTIDAGETEGTATFTLTPVDDAVDENNETVSVGGTVQGLPVTAATLTIADDDTRGVQVSRTAVTPPEGGTDTYTVVLLSAPTGTVTVTPGLGGDSDVTVDPSALTFTATTWETAQTVTVSAAEDADAEADTATITHAVAGADYGSENAASVAVTVTDNETASTALTLSVEPDSVAENAGATSVTVKGTLNAAPLTSEKTVSVSVSADTASSADYGSVSGFTLTIAAGETSGTATFTLTPVNDDVDEDDETITIGGTVQGFTVTEAALTIEDDDTRGVEVSRTEVTPSEGGTDTYTVVLLSAPTGQVTVTPSVSGDPDVTVDPAALTFAAATWSAAQTVTVSAAEDADAEGDTATITHAVAGADYGSEDAASVAVTVTDNETASTGVALSVEPDSVSENAGATSVTVTGALNAAPLTSEKTVSVSVSAGTASSTDFGSVSAFNLTIDAGETSGTATFSFTPVDDAVDEDDETVAVGGAVQGLTVTAATLTIEDDDTRGVQVSETAVTAPEGGDATYTVVLLSAPTGQVTVTPGVSDNPDVTVQPPALTFTATTWETAQTVTVSAAEDGDAEADTATVTHTVAGADYGSETAADVAVTVTDNETASSSVTLSVDPDSVSENAAATVLTVKGMLDGAPLTSDATVSVSVSPGTAASTDYGSVSGFALTIEAGEASGEATFTLTPVNDDVDEDDETVTIEGTLDGFTVTGAALTIEDDDTLGVEVSGTEVTVPEGGDATYTVVLLSAPTGEVTVTPDVSGSPDVTVEPPALTFTATTWSTAQTVKVSAAEDGDAEADTATVTHTVAGADYGSETAADVAVTVTDNETASTEITLSVGPDSVPESAAATSVTVTGTLNGAPLNSATTVSVTVSAGTASSTDFGAVSGFDLTIDAEKPSGTATFTFAPTSDDVDEEDETVSVAGTVQGLDVTAATLLIEDDDTRGVQVSRTQMTVPEGGDATYTVALLSAPTGEVTVTPGVSGNPEVTVQPPALTFTATTWSAAQTVTVSAAEDTDAEEDTATITHTVAGADYGSEPAADIAVKVIENETAPSGVDLTVDPDTVAEGGGARAVTVTGTLDGAPLSTDVTVSVSVSGGTASADDFDPVAAFTLTIEAGQTSGEATFTLTPVDDDADEDDETVVVGGSVQGMSVTGASVTITDDDETEREEDTAKPTFIDLSVLPPVAPEGAGPTSVALTATLRGALVEGAVTISVSVTPGSAAAGDFEAVADFELTIDSGETTGEATFTLTPVDDELEEGSETVVVQGTAGTIEVRSATLTIEDDDVRGVTVVPTEVTVPEGGSAVYTVALMAEPSGPVTVTTSVNDEGLMVFPSVLLFTRDDWATGQTVTVSMVEGRTPEPSSPLVVSNIVAGADYEGMPADDVSVAMSNGAETTAPVPALPAAPADPSTMVTLSVSPSRVGEGSGGELVTVTALLDRDPAPAATTVSLSLSRDEASAGDFARIGGLEVTIPTGEVEGATSFMFRPVDDDMDEEDEEVSLVGTAPGLVVNGTTLMIEDDDTRGLRAGPAELVMDEGGSAGYALVLESQPTGPVTVTARLSGSPDLSVSPAELTFLASNWDEEQEFVVSAAHDPDAEEDAGVVSLVLSGGDYGSMTAEDVPVTVVEDEVASTVVALSLDPERIAEEGGPVDVVVTGALDQAPLTSDLAVVLTLSGGTAAAEDFVPAEDVLLTIAAGETTGAVAFTVTPVDDWLVEGEETLVIGGMSDSLAVNPAMLTVRDNDRRGLTVEPMSIAVDEGDNSSYAVSLWSQPMGSVTVRAAVSGSSDVTLTPAELVFTELDWQGERTVTVSAAHDADAEDEQATIEHRVSGADYDGETADDVAVQVLDDDEESTTAVLSVDPQTVSESPGGTVVTVTATLDQAARMAPTTVTVSVAPGTASARDLAPVRDFPLTIEAGETSGSADVTLHVVEDGVAEEEETLTVSGRVADLAVVPAVIVIEADDDPLPAAWLARFGRTVAEAVLEVVERRRQQRGESGLRVTVGGYDVSGRPGAAGAAGAGQRPFLVGSTGTPGTGYQAFPVSALPGGAGTIAGASGGVSFGIAGANGHGPSAFGQPGLGGGRPLGPGAGAYQDWALLSNTSFSYGQKASEESGVFTLWGSGSFSYVRAGGEGLNLNGNVATMNLGADYGRGALFYGVVLSHSLGDGRLAGEGKDIPIRSTLTGLFPHLTYRLNDRVALWSVLGHGTGDLTLNAGDGATTTGMDMNMAAVGLAGTLLTRTDGLSLQLKADALLVSTSSEEAEDLPAADAEVDRLRLALAGTYRRSLGERSSLTPRLELGVRRDGGDAETGLGLDLGGGLALQHAGLSLDLGGRRLIAHEESGFEDWGYAVRVSYDLSPASKRGLVLSLSPTWGSSPSNGAEALWSGHAMNSMAFGGLQDTDRQRLEAKAEYRLPFFGGTGAPSLGLTTSSYSRDYNLGYTASLSRPGRLDLRINVLATRSESSMETAEPTLRLGLDAVVSW
ncbi:MAG: hypothetical protein F4210_05680, partial [Holophagales bacterium]|nr:hypothetical protein [Holophagales bacterium]